MGKSPVIIPMPAPQQPSGPNMVEKGTLDVVRDTTLARISASGAHVLAGLAMRCAAEQAAEAEAVNPQGDQLLEGRCSQYMAQFDLVVNTAFMRIARPLKLDSRGRSR